MPPKRTVHIEPADAAARKRSRTGKHDKVGNGERIPIMKKVTARISKAIVDAEERKKEQKAEANKRKYERAKAAKAEKKRKEEEELNMEFEIDDQVARVIESAHATTSANLIAFLHGFIAVEVLEMEAAVTSAVEREVELEGVERVNLEDLSRIRGQIGHLAGGGVLEAGPSVLEADAPVSEARRTTNADQDGEETHCRPKDNSKSHARGANTGGCGRAFTHNNRAVGCCFDGCNKVKFCTDCKDNQEKGMLVHLDGKQEWFCSERCVDRYNRGAEEENARADKNDAAKKARMKESRKQCACGRKFSEKNPDSGCARNEECTRAHACYDCVRSGRSTRGMSGKFDMNLRQEWFCSGSCYYETYPNEDEEEDDEPE